jgi:hypothetical protein
MSEAKEMFLSNYISFDLRKFQTGYLPNPASVIIGSFNEDAYPILTSTFKFKLSTANEGAISYPDSIYAKNL